MTYWPRWQFAAPSWNRLDRRIIFLSPLCEKQGHATKCLGTLWETNRFTTTRKDESILSLTYPCLPLSKISQSAKGYSHILELSNGCCRSLINYYLGIKLVFMSWILQCFASNHLVYWKWFSCCCFTQMGVWKDLVQRTTSFPTDLHGNAEGSHWCILKGTSKGK